MLSFDVRSLAVQAAKVEGALAPNDEVWLTEDVRPDATLTVVGRLSGAGNGRFYFNGRFSGTVTLECRRCLTPVSVAVGEEMAVIFADVEGQDLDDPDIFVLAAGGKKVDVRPAVREQWLLNVPSFAECRPDCRGICPTCGADLNAGACSCAPVPDRRWNALRATRSQAD
jgi:uncharacterized protein